MARAFVSNPENKPYVHHIDGIKFNCHASNLEWVTRSENMKYNFQLGLSTQPLGEESCRAILKNNQAESAIILYETGRYSYQEIGDILGVNAGVIGEIVRGEHYKNCREPVSDIVARLRGEETNMENALQIFSNEAFGKVRGVEIDGEAWVVGKDVAAALGYANPERSIRAHVDEEDKRVTEMVTPGGRQTVKLINESGVYSLIFSSKLPTAKEFKHWVTSEVLPSIRKTGEYKSNVAPKETPTDKLERAKLLLEAAKVTENASLRDELLREMARQIIPS